MRDSCDVRETIWLFLCMFGNNAVFGSLEGSVVEHLAPGEKNIN